MSAGAASIPAPQNPGSFWKRRVIGPLALQLRQGVTPEKLAVTVALGLVLGIFPILGSTTLLCAVAGFALRLNQPVIQLVNYVAYPLQIALIIPTYRAGEILFGRDPVPLSFPYLFERFNADFMQFLRDFGLIAIQGIVVWCIVAPIAAAGIYAGVRPLLRKLSRQLP